jgi:hypothetical protein
MMRLIRRCALLGSLVGVLCVVPTAAATAPDRFTSDFQVSDTIDCSEFNPAWTFSDNFTDFFHIESAVFSDAQGNPLRALNHVEHTSNDVNSVTGFTLHEHNHYVVIEDFVSGTITLNGAINIMQRRGIGSVIQNTGHKVIDAETGEPITLAGPNKADDADFCAAIAP